MDEIGHFGLNSLFLDFTGQFNSHWVRDTILKVSENRDH